MSNDQRQAARCRMAAPDWLISGGESGGGARLVKLQWVRDVIVAIRAISAEF